MNKSNFYTQLKQEEKELKETLAALQVLIKRYEFENESTLSYKKNDPESIIIQHAVENLNSGIFDNSKFEDLSIPKKILYSLKELKKGTSKEVAEKAHALDNSRSLEKWIDDSRYYLSKYYNEKKLIVLKDNSVRGNVYAFPM